MSAKRGTKRGTIMSAKQILAELDIPVGADFHTLPATSIVDLLLMADRVAYRYPSNTKRGSRAQHFHEKLQRLARRTP